jgi:hypothetical protein
MKEKKIKYKEINHGYNLFEFVEVLKKAKSNFIFENSNYTAKIITEKTEITFTTKNLNITAFVGASKIRGDLKNFTKNIIPTINSQDLEYYQQNLTEQKLNYVANFDLTKAYPSILYNDGFISLETFEYLCSIGKTERLAAIGMLARKKNIITFENGKAQYFEINKKETSPIFYHLVQKTNFIISEIRKLNESKFLFSWVDGIYFEIENQNEIDFLNLKVLEICNIYNMKFTFELLNNYESYIENNCFRISFYKGENEKRFTIPTNEIRASYEFYKKINQLPIN